MSATAASQRPWWVLGLPAVAVFGLVFWPTFRWMGERFSTHDSFYSHGWLIPVASAWLIWQRRARLGGLAKQPSAWGLALLVPSLLLHVVATWWQVGIASGIALLGTVWGTVWTLWGAQTLWALRGPLLFLIFMVPLPGILLVGISFQMKLAAASLATAVIQLLGTPAVQLGSTIEVPGVSVVVDDTCSGLRSLISLIALSTLWTAIMPPSAKRWHKLTMVAFSIPIALTANMVRIITLVFLSAIYGPKVADGFIHYGSGVVVFGIALLALAWLSKRLVGPQRLAFTS